MKTKKKSRQVTARAGSAPEDAPRLPFLPVDSGVNTLGVRLLNWLEGKNLEDPETKLARLLHQPPPSVVDTLLRVEDPLPPMPPAQPLAPMETLPPQPFGDTTDIQTYLLSEEALGLCAVCGQFKPRVGQWGGPSSMVCCFACWKRAYPETMAPGTVRAAPGNPLNL